MCHWRQPSGGLYDDEHGICVALISKVLIVEAPAKVNSSFAVSVDPELPISMYTIGKSNIIRLIVLTVLIITTYCL